MKTAVYLGLVLAASFAQAQEAHEHDTHAHDAHAGHSGAGHAQRDPAPAAHAGMDHAQMDHAAMGHAAMGHAGHGTDSAADARPPARHVPPPPPQSTMHDMSAAEMVEVMGMDDRARWGLVAFDRFEIADGGDFGWSGRADYGGDIDRLRLRSEGERVDGRVGHASVELLWSHAIAPFWDTQVGVRHDFGSGPDRQWAAFGIQGLAPYWFELGATAYVGEQGRTALRAEVEYELLLTQRLVLQPRSEVNAYGRSDHAAGVGAGISDAVLGLRLRYEIKREFAPYVGIERRWLFGGSADHARSDGEAVADTRLVAGVRFWF